MKEFFVGLLVLIMMGALSLLGVLLLPLLLLLGIFLRVLVGFALLLLMIWLIGKLTLASITYLRKKEPPAGF